MKYICPDCNVVNDSLDWDKTTINNNCYNRKQRRAFIPITSSASNNWYECPNCGGRNYKYKIKVVK